MKNQWNKIVMLSIFVAALIMSAFPLAQVAQAKGLVTRISLTSSAKYPAAKATAKYKLDTQREFQVEIENVRSLAGKTLGVYVNGKKVGSFVVSTLGTGRLNLNTTRGEIVPMIKAGSLVTIKFGAVLVSSGKF